MKRNRLATVVALSTALLVAAPTAANAATVSGSRECPIGRSVWVHSVTTGSTSHTHTAGGSSFKYDRYHATATSWSTSKAFRIEDWRVYATTYIQSGAGTTCEN